MTWVRLEDSFGDHPKIVEAGELAGWLYVMGLCYCGRHLTDGFIPARALPKLTALPKRELLATALVRVGLWREVDGGWQVHNYEERQRTRSQVEFERSSAKVRANNRRTSREVRNQIREEKITTPQTPQGGLVDNSGQWHPDGCGCSLCDFEGDELAKRRNA